MYGAQPIRGQPWVPNRTASVAKDKGRGRQELWKVEITQNFASEGPSLISCLSEQEGRRETVVRVEDREKCGRR